LMQEKKFLLIGKETSWAKWVCAYLWYMRRLCM
jgi:hypothetical protein